MRLCYDQVLHPRLVEGSYDLSRFRKKVSCGIDIKLGSCVVLKTQRDYLDDDDEDDDDDDDYDVDDFNVDDFSDDTVDENVGDYVMMILIMIRSLRGGSGTEPWPGDRLRSVQSSSMLVEGSYDLSRFRKKVSCGIDIKLGSCVVLKTQRDYLDDDDEDDDDDDDYDVDDFNVDDFSDDTVDENVGDYVMMILIMIRSLRGGSGTEPWPGDWLRSVQSSSMYVGT
ncbi:hypothetical protein ACLB2K_021136 [Fragaria x ananassa]